MNKSIDEVFNRNFLLNSCSIFHFFPNSLLSVSCTLPESVYLSFHLYIRLSIHCVINNQGRRGAGCAPAHLYLLPHLAKIKLWPEKFASCTNGHTQCLVASADPDTRICFGLNWWLWRMATPLGISRICLFVFMDAFFRGKLDIPNGI